jgi:SAM-dependent methyltransferase
MLLPITRRFLQEAGIAAGMKVLDVGSGAGDVALLLADLVSPSGTVVGVDRNPVILHTARARVQAAGRSNVSFVVDDLATLMLDTDFDAVVGRFVLQHLFTDPAVVLRKLIRHLRPGGIVAFQETNLTHLGTGFPRSLPYEQIGYWMREAFRRTGLDYQMGLRLYEVFLGAGLPAPQVHCESSVGAGPDWPGYEVRSESVRSVLPVLVKFGIATAEEVDIDTLAQRFRDSVVNQRGIVKNIEIVSAWTRTMS